MILEWWHIALAVLLFQVFTYLADEMLRRLFPLLALERDTRQLQSTLKKMYPDRDSLAVNFKLSCEKCKAGEKHE